MGLLLVLVVAFYGLTALSSVSLVWVAALAFAAGITVRGKVARFVRGDTRLERRRRESGWRGAR